MSQDQGIQKNQDQRIIAKQDPPEEEQGDIVEIGTKKKREFQEHGQKKLTSLMYHLYWLGFLSLYLLWWITYLQIKDVENRLALKQVQISKNQAEIGKLIEEKFKRQEEQLEMLKDIQQKDVGWLGMHIIQIEKRLDAREQK